MNATIQGPQDLKNRVRFYSLEYKNYRRNLHNSPPFLGRFDVNYWLQIEVDSKSVTLKWFAGKNRLHAYSESEKVDLGSISAETIWYQEIAWIWSKTWFQFKTIWRCYENNLILVYPLWILVLSWDEVHWHTYGKRKGDYRLTFTP